MTLSITTLNIMPQYYSTEHNDTQHYNTEHNDTQHYNTEHNGLCKTGLKTFTLSITKLNLIGA